MEDLKSLREAAGLSQQQLAEQLGHLQPQETWDQSKVSRYERDPESVPAGAYLAMLRILGQTQMVVEGPDLPGVDVGSPYASLREQLDTIHSVVEDGQLSGVDEDAAQSVSDLTRSFREKPRVALLGKFDAGKTTLINTLLGERHLPTGFQPQTWLPTYVMHTEDRPPFIEHDVILMRHGLDMRRWRERDHFRQHMGRAGSFDLLERDEVTHDEGLALAFCDAPVLRSCTLIDMPGFGESMDSIGLTEIARFEAVIFADSCNGFLDGTSLTQLTEAVNMLRSESQTSESWLSRVAVTATHAHSGISSSTMNSLLSSAAQRWDRHMGTIDPNGSTTAADLRQRMTAFAPENSERVRDFLENIRTMLKNTLPEQHISSAQETFDLLYRSLRSSLTERQEEAEYSARHSDELAAAADALERDRAEFMSVTDTKAIAAREQIQQLSVASVGSTKSILDSYTPERIEVIIRRGFTERKDASRNAPALIHSAIRTKIEKDLSRQASQLSTILDGFGDSLSKTLDDLPGATGKLRAGPGMRARFVGGLGGGALGAAGVGAIGAYAATLGNLGAYILVAQGVGVLSTLGISVGGGAAAVTAVAAIGGPITLGLAAVAVTAVVGTRLVRGDWRKQLAREIHKKVVLAMLLGTPKTRRSEASPPVHEALSAFWAGVREDFDRGVDAVVAGYDEKIAELREHADDPAHYRRLAATLKAALASLDTLPWPGSSVPNQ
ncbi:helix-turn-helix domain-containing protein [Propionibacteriaceae bacterium Y2011]